MKTLILYGTLGCHLCEQALELITPLIGGEYSLVEIDISDSSDLIERYGIRIPVVAMQGDGAEIGWPFDGEDFVGFLQSGY
ncbi:MAG: glutaredoxin family protein [Oceanicoccus sp.]